MKLRAKIEPKYLSEILLGHKTREFREIDCIELHDGNRTIVFEIDDARVLPKKRADRVRKHHSDIIWGGSPMLEIKIGKVLSTTFK